MYDPRYPEVWRVIGLGAYMILALRHAVSSAAFSEALAQHIPRKNFLVLCNEIFSWLADQPSDRFDVAEHIVGVQSIAIPSYQRSNFCHFEIICRFQDHIRVREYKQRPLRHRRMTICYLMFWAVPQSRAKISCSDSKEIESTFRYFPCNSAPYDSLDRQRKAIDLHAHRGSLSRQNDIAALLDTDITSPREARIQTAIASATSQPQSSRARNL